MQTFNKFYTYFLDDSGLNVCSLLVAELKGEASNRAALSLRICIFVYIMYIRPTQPGTPQLCNCCCPSITSRISRSYPFRQGTPRIFSIYCFLSVCCAQFALYLSVKLAQRWLQSHFHILDDANYAAWPQPHTPHPRGMWSRWLLFTLWPLRLAHLIVFATIQCLIWLATSFFLSACSCQIMLSTGRRQLYWPKSTLPALFQFMLCTSFTRDCLHFNVCPSLHRFIWLDVDRMTLWASRQHYLGQLPALLHTSLLKSRSQPCEDGCMEWVALPFVVSVMAKLLAAYLLLLQYWRRLPEIWHTSWEG